MVKNVSDSRVCLSYIVKELISRGYLILNIKGYLRYIINKSKIKE